MVSYGAAKPKPRIMMLRSVHLDATFGSMRTTVTLDDDVAAEVERLRRESGMGLSEALNQLARTGLTARRRRSAKAFHQQTEKIGLRVNVDNIGDVLELLDAEPS